MTNLIKISDPKKPGDFLLIGARDFDPAKHVRFEEGGAQAPPPPTPAAPISTPKRTRKGKP